MVPSLNPGEDCYGDGELSERRINQINQHFSRLLSQPTHLETQPTHWGTQPKRTKGTDREPTIHLETSNDIIAEDGK